LGPRLPTSHPPDRRAVPNVAAQLRQQEALLSRKYILEVEAVSNKVSVLSPLTLASDERPMIFVTLIGTFNFELLFFKGLFPARTY